jgi:hypothetical protein
MSMGLPASTVNSVTVAPMRSITSRMRRPKRPATMTRTLSPGSTSESALDSSAVLPEPGMVMTSPAVVWNTFLRARFTGSSTARSKLWS